MFSNRRMSAFFCRASLTRRLRSSVTVSFSPGARARRCAALSARSHAARSGPQPHSSTISELAPLTASASVSGVDPSRTPQENAGAGGGAKGSPCSREGGRGGGGGADAAAAGGSEAGLRDKFVWSHYLMLPVLPKLRDARRS